MMLPSTLTFAVSAGKSPFFQASPRLIGALVDQISTQLQAVGEASASTGAALVTRSSAK
jgi:hypothetical protein